MVPGAILFIGVASLQVLSGWAKEAQILQITPKEISPENAKGGVQKLVDSGIFKRAKKSQKDGGRNIKERQRGLGRTGRQGGQQSAARQGNGRPARTGRNQGSGNRNGGRGSQGESSRWGHMYDDLYYPMDDPYMYDDPYMDDYIYLDDPYLMDE